MSCFLSGLLGGDISQALHLGGPARVDGNGGTILGTGKVYIPSSLPHLTTPFDASRRSETLCLREYDM